MRISLENMLSEVLFPEPHCAWGRILSVFCFYLCNLVVNNNFCYGNKVNGMDPNWTPPNFDILSTALDCADQYDVYVKMIY
uniref:Uncharacterized protein n=1 Tax=Anguilla anguilla TaxID=7936 RepID=A0A0E9WL38_ANGAN